MVTEVVQQVQGGVGGEAWGPHRSPAQARSQPTTLLPTWRRRTRNDVSPMERRGSREAYGTSTMESVIWMWLKSVGALLIPASGPPFCL